MTLGGRTHCCVVWRRAWRGSQVAGADPSWSGGMGGHVPVGKGGATSAVRALYALRLHDPLSGGLQPARHPSSDRAGGRSSGPTGIPPRSLRVSACAASTARTCPSCAPFEMQGRCTADESPVPCGVRGDSHMPGALDDRAWGRESLRWPQTGGTATLASTPRGARRRPTPWGHPCSLHQSPAEIAAGLLPLVRNAGLSLGDLACLGLALDVTPIR